MSSSTQRSAVIDMCKGFGIVLVVYGHCLRGLVASGKIPETSWLNITDYVIYTFHMPLFFVLSGYFFRHPAGNDIRKFCKSKALGIVLPYVLWSLVQGSIQVALASSGATNGELGVDRLYSILWLPISPFWFLYALFFCNLVALATHRIPLALSISIATLFFLTSFWTLHYVVKDIAYGCVYFLIGMAARKYAWQSLFPATPLRAIACWALFAASVWVCFLCDVPDRLSLPAALLGILATLMTAAQLNCGSALSPLAQALALAGRCSMGIFVLHIIALGFARQVLSAGLGIDHGGLTLILATMFGVIAPLVFQIIAGKLNLSVALGLGRPVTLSQPPAAARKPRPAFHSFRNSFPSRRVSR